MYASQRFINESRWEEEAQRRDERRALEYVNLAEVRGDTRHDSHVEAHKRHERYLRVAAEYPIGVEAYLLRGALFG